MASTRSSNMIQLAEFELVIQAIDHPTDRRRWNGDPMASEDAGRAMHAAVDAARGVLREHGFEITHTGYGVKATEVADD